MIYVRTVTTAIICASISLAGCGGGNYDGGGNHGGGYVAPPTTTTQILSDSGLDGDIEQTSPTSLNVTQGMSPSVQSVFAGIDPVGFTEFRAFLDFPLTGAGGIPVYTTIDSAFLDLFVKNIQPIDGRISIRIELVSFQPPTLLATDFDRTVQPQLTFARVISLSPADVGTNVSIDVTSLMVEAQRLRVMDFQLRVLEDLGPPIPVLLEINDTTGSNRQFHAPLLTVTYY